MAKHNPFEDLLKSLQPQGRSSSVPAEGSLPSFEEFQASQEEKSKKTPETTVSPLGVVTDSQGKFVGRFKNIQGPEAFPGDTREGAPGLPAGFADELARSFGQGAGLPGPAGGDRVQEQPQAQPSLLDLTRERASKAPAPAPARAKAKAGKSLGKLPGKANLKKRAAETKAAGKKAAKKGGTFAEGFNDFAEGFVSARQGRAPRTSGKARRQALESQAQRADATRALRLLIEQGRAKRSEQAVDIAGKQRETANAFRREAADLSAKKSKQAFEKQAAKGKAAQNALQANVQTSVSESSPASALSRLFGGGPSVGDSEIIAKETGLSQEAAQQRLLGIAFDEQGNPRSDQERQQLTQQFVQEFSSSPSQAQQPQAQAQPRSLSPEDRQALIEKLRREGKL